MIWLALSIPLIAILILVFNFKHKVNLAEYAVVFLVPIVCILVSKYVSIYTQTKDTEYWNSFATNAIYEEEWKEEWTELESYTTTDSKGNTTTHYRLVHKSRYHPEEWNMSDNIGETYSISQDYFEYLCKLWNKREFRDMQRESGPHDITIDGDAYVTSYDNIFDHTVPICSKHSYENKIQCSKSVFNFQDVDIDTVNHYGLFEFPHENLLDFNPVLGHNDKEATRLLRIYNALHGYRRQLHMMLLIFKNQPLQAGTYQEAYWKGGNKNEFIVCVGVAENKITWTKVISWTDQTVLKVRVAREIKEMENFDAVKIAKYMGENIPKDFVRKQFADFSYIRVEPTIKTVIWTYIITLIVTIVSSIIAIVNDCDA